MNIYCCFVSKTNASDYSNETLFGVYHSNQASIILGGLSSYDILGMSSSIFVLSEAAVGNMESELAA